jgi:glycosyltransferase involved in cell wall biosynthesis
VQVTPSLTIAVPTYNRKRWLSLTLPEIIEQAREVPPGDIEVVVSDNCSSDGTWEYLQELASKVCFLKIHRNETNIGAEANFYLLPTLASGRYLHMIGDDDLLISGALSRIRSALRDEPDYVVINFDLYNSTLDKCARKNQLNAFQDQVFDGPEDCLSRVDAMTAGFISMWVAKREFFNVIPEEKFHYFAKWGMSIQSDRYFGISRFPKGRLVAESCLRTRQNTDLRDDVFFSWFMTGSAEVFSYTASVGVLSNSVILTLKRRLLLKNALQRVRYERRTGMFKSAETYRLLRADYGNFLEFWLLCVPTMFTPGLGFMINILRRLLGRADS